MKAIGRVRKFKLRAEVVETLRKRGGAHSTKKGGRGYDRKKIKHNGEIEYFPSLSNNFSPEEIFERELYIIIKNREENHEKTRSQRYDYCPGLAGLHVSLWCIRFFRLHYAWTPRILGNKFYLVRNDPFYFINSAGIIPNKQRPF